MTLAEVLPLAYGLGPDERLALAEEMWQSVPGDEALDDEVLDLVQRRVAHIHSHPQDNIEWSEFLAAIDDRLGKTPA